MRSGGMLLNVCASTQIQSFWLSNFHIVGPNRISSQLYWPAAWICIGCRVEEGKRRMRWKQMVQITSWRWCGVCGKWMLTIIPLAGIHFLTSNTSYLSGLLPCIRWWKSSDVTRVGVPCLLLRVIKALSERQRIDVISKALYQIVEFTLMEVQSSHLDWP